MKEEIKLELFKHTHIHRRGEDYKLLEKRTGDINLKKETRYYFHSFLNLLLSFGIFINKIILDKSIRLLHKCINVKNHF